MRPVKEQITRLALAQVSLAVVYSNDRSRQVQTQIIDRIDLWHEQDGDRRIRWPTVVELSPRYFADLQEHGLAIPGGTCLPSRRMPTTSSAGTGRGGHPTPFTRLSTVRSIGGSFTATNT